MMVWRACVVLCLLLASVGTTHGRYVESHFHGRRACPTSWTAYKLRCFRFFIDQLNWSEAENTCLSHGGNLASVHSSDENRFIKDLIYNYNKIHHRAWLGGYDAVNEGSWFWSDGSKMSFKLWATGEPNNQKDEDCMEINLGGMDEWNDTLCNAKKSFVCVK